MDFFKKVFGKKEAPKPKCPYCEIELVEPPKRKKKCPGCKNFIYVIKLEDGDKLVTENEKAAHDKKKEELKFIEELDDREIISEAGYFEYKFKYYKKVGENTKEKSFLWSLCNYLLNELAKANDFDSMKFIYEKMAELQKDKPKDYIMWKKCAMKMGLFNYINMGIKVSVHVLGSENSCESCKALSKKKYTLDEAINEMPLPNETCTREYGCTCCYTVLPEED